MPEREHAAKLYTEINGLRQDSEAREFVVADLRRQVIDLLPSKHEASTLRRQLGLLDERVRSRDGEHQAQLDELNAKLQLHETVEAQLEAQVQRVEEERLTMQRKLGEQLAAAEARVAEAKATTTIKEADTDDRLSTAHRAAREAAERAEQLSAELEIERAVSACMRDQARVSSEMLADAQRTLTEARREEKELRSLLDATLSTAEGTVGQLRLEQSDAKQTAHYHAELGEALARNSGYKNTGI